MRIDPHEELKTWLRRYQELQSDADRLWNRTGELLARIESTRTSILDGMPHGSSVDADRIGADLAHLEDLEREAAEAQQEATTARREIEGAIRQIHGPRWPDRREVLRLRYLDCMKWEDATERLFGDSQDFWDKSDLFLRRAYKLHTQALEELAKYVPFSTGQKIGTEDKKL